MTDVLGRLGGHLWTVAPFVARTVRPPRAPVGEARVLEVQDARFGSVRLNGVLSIHPDPVGSLLLVHGLSGNAESGYVREAAALARTRRLTVLRLSLRGADGDGEDLYHAGLTGDLVPALALLAETSPGPVAAMGFSLGGHLVLRAAADRLENLDAVAAVCPPLHLGEAARALDAPSAWVYRRMVLRDLHAHYAALDARGRAPTPIDNVAWITHIRTWDELTVAPRHGFSGAEDYYATQSVAPRLGEVRIPTLIGIAPDDPMIPLSVVEPHLRQLPDAVTVRRLTGGHVGFPKGVLSGMVDWLADQLDPRR